MSICSRAARVIAVLAVVSVAPAISGAQAAPAAPPTLLKVGEMAPDFTVTVVTAAGVVAKPFKLSEHKGETVVLAFFPKARTSGCTVQMESYRDQYAQTFQSGKKVTLVGVSIDSATALVSWATEAKFQFHFAADTDRKVGVAYGANAGTGYHKRTLYVIDPSGKISYVTAQFNQMSADAYTELATAISHAGGSH
ncbi:peroxiredoxin family protein [Gemmatimonas sp.]|uniref:peroxiredoxin family protein n=1 Tax=Gemmatimonas sp. TaxID=1962908 RepID=UPI003983A972